MDVFQSYLEQLGAGGYWLLLAVTFGESFVLAGFLVPGTTVLVFMGAVAQFGYYEYPLLAVSASIGGLMGSIASYEMGRAGKFHVEKVRFVGKHIAGSKAFLNRYKAASIFLSRFIGPIRPVVPFVAGLVDMKRSLFYGYTLISTMVWCAAYIGLGYIFSYAWEQALAWSSLAVAGVIIVGIVTYLSFRRWRTQTIEQK